jgi:replicative DNA helicase
MNEFQEARIPPNDLDAEAAVVATILLDPARMTEVTAILQPEHFWSNANKRIYEAFLGLVEQDKAIDIMTVRSWLEDHNRLQDVGGPKYLAEILDMVPVISNVDTYAKRVKNKWRLRNVISMCRQKAAEAYLVQEEEVDQFLEGVDGEVAKATRNDDSTKDDTLYTLGASVKNAFQDVQNRIKQQEKGQAVKPMTGFTKLDEMIGGVDYGEFCVIAARPSMGKSSLAYQIAAHNAGADCTPRIGVLIVSAETTNIKVALSMVSQDARFDLSLFHTLKIQSDAWPKLIKTANTLSKLPVYIDDKSSPSLGHVRNTIRRVQAALLKKNDKGEVIQRLGLVIVDYIQLCDMETKSEKTIREQVVAYVTRGLHRSAKDFGVAMIGLAQLNRGVEGRSDKRPILSDIRECVAGSERVPRSDTGAIVRMSDMRESLPVYGLGDHNVVQAADVSEAWSTGVKPVFKMVCRSGRHIRCTDNHPFLTVQGWKRLDALAAGDVIATARSVPEPSHPTNPFTHDELRLLGYLVCCGSYAKHRTVSYVKGDLSLVADACKIVLDRFGLHPKEKPCQGESRQVEFTTGCREGPGKNPLINWLKQIGIHGQTSVVKALPWNVFESDNASIAVLLGATWAGDGTVGAHKSCRGGRMKFTSSSTELIEQVSWMLLRMGIDSAVDGPIWNQKSKLPLWEITIYSWQDIVRFYERVPIPGVKGQKLAKIIRENAPEKDNTQRGRLPLCVTEEIVVARRGKRLSWAQLGYRCQKKRICQDDLRQVAARLKNQRLLDLASEDVLWDEIVSITPDGEEECFDVRIPETGSFVVSRFLCHNSGELEQAAEKIIALYRDDYYNKGKSKGKEDLEGITEAIVLKSKGTAIGTAKLKFTKECVRHDNLEVEEDEWAK